MPAISGLLSKGKGALGWAKGKLGPKANAAIGWYGGLSNTAKYGIAGAASGAMSGAFGINPFNSVPFFGDVDAGGGLGGALAGGLAGMAFGRFGAGRFHKQGGLMNAGRNALMWQTGGRAVARGEGSLIGRGLYRANNLLGREKLGQFTNRYGNMTLNALGAGAAGLIGGSILSTNSPY